MRPPRLAPAHGPAAAARPTGRSAAPTTRPLWPAHGPAARPTRAGLARLGRLLSLWGLLLALGLLPGLARGHGMRTAYLEVTETAPGEAVANLRTTLPSPAVRPVFPPGCAVTRVEQPDPAAAPAPLSFAPGQERSFLLRCPAPLRGQALGVQGLGPVLTEAVVRVALADGRVASGVLLPPAERWTIPGGAPPRPGPAVSLGALAGRYLALGVRHILSGPDHLLFLLGLVLLVRRARAVLILETAFTFSHSLSFSLVALGLVRFPSAVAEALIALSLVLLALDLAPPGPLRDLRPRPEAVRFAPALCLGFGLVHGLGFAGGLGEVGLPEQDVGWALLSFGLGVELGQLLFLAALLLVFALLQRTPIQGYLQAAGAYALGALGAFWLISRVQALLPGIHG